MALVTWRGVIKGRYRIFVAETRSELAAMIRFERSGPHELWEYGFCRSGVRSSPAVAKASWATA